MPTPNDRKRLALFDLYAKNASLHDQNKTGGCFTCPVCRKQFKREACIGERCAVNLAHVYPKACGCRLTTLACSACNSTQGAKYDTEIAQEREITAALAGHRRASLKAEFNVLGEPFRVNLSRAGNEIELEMAEQANSSAAIAKVHEKLKGGICGLRLVISHRITDRFRLQYGLLYCAHLVLFREFGYEYLGSRLGEWVRGLITEDPSGKRIPFPIFSLHSADGFDASAHYKVMLLTEPAEYRTIWVLLPTPNPGHAARAVVLPGDLDEDSLNAFQAVKDLRPARASFVVGSPPPAGRLGEEQWKFHMRDCWRSACPAKAS